MNSFRKKILNKIKHNRTQFNSWDEGIFALKNAFKILEDNRLGA